MLSYFRALMRAAIGTGFNPYDNHAQAMAAAYIATAPTEPVSAFLARQAD
jgi:hypothetical protein